MTNAFGVQDFLSKLPLFNELAPGELADIVLATTEVQVARGNMVFNRGESCVGFHILVRGLIKLALVSHQGGEKVVKIIVPGQSFGEALMFMERPYIVSAQALADSLLLHVPKQTVFAEIERHPRFAHKMLAGLSQRLHGLMSDIEAYTLHSGTRRVIDYFLKHGALIDGDRFRLEVSKTVLASRLNLTPEHFSRILRDLCANELIVVKGRLITITDVQRLHEHRG